MGRSEATRRGDDGPRSRAPRPARVMRAPAKINLTLEVVGRLPDGYHAIRSVMTRLPNLADTVRVAVRDGDAGVSIRTNSPEIPVDDTNICHRAARRFLEHAGATAHVAIDIEKAVPVAAGLGGGSSDAAAVLLALNGHYRNRIDARALASIGAALGKDVPFFLDTAPTMQASGMGERLRPVAARPRCHVLIVNPRIAMATGDAYRALGSDLWFMTKSTRADRTRRMVAALRSGDLRAIAAALYNDFELVAERAQPALKEIKLALSAFGAAGSLMSGSGSTVFGLFASKPSLLAAQAALGAHYPGFFIARG